MADQNGRRAAKIKGINKNHFIHHFLSTILLQELANYDCRGPLGLTVKFDYILSGHKKRQIVNWPQDVVKGHKNQYKLNRCYIVIYILKSSKIKYRLLIYTLYCKKNDIDKIYHKYMGSKIAKINKNENFAVYNCHMYTQIVWNLRLVTNIIHYKAKNIRKENLDLYRFTHEYEHIRKILSFSFKKIPMWPNSTDVHPSCLPANVYLCRPCIVL